MDQPDIVPLLRPADHFHMVAAVAAFIAGGPDNDAGMILEILHHSAHPFHKFALPLRLGAGPCVGFHIEIVIHIGQSAEESMGLDVRFADHVQTDLITHLNEFRGRRIVGSTDTIHIQFLHQEQIFAQFLIALAPAPMGAGIMVINTMKLHRNAVDQQCVFIGNFNLPQAGF